MMDARVYKYFMKKYVTPSRRRAYGRPEIHQ
jgi:hypothetical protein